VRVDAAVVIDAATARDLLVVYRALQAKARQGDSFNRQVLGDAHRFECLVRECSELVVQAELVGVSVVGPVRRSVIGDGATVDGQTPVEWIDSTAAGVILGCGRHHALALTRGRADVRRRPVGRSWLSVKVDVVQLAELRAQKRERHG
jgi:hypothetical protein